ncbi:MAG: c-type cytochrome [Planctomycetota bacterium]|jgi:mono/diheme cytochrome c family protein
MTRAHWWTVLATLFVCFILIQVGADCVGIDPEHRNVEIFREMVDSQAHEAFAKSAAFPDGKTIQKPVEGTIARGFIPLRYGTTLEEARRAGEELVNPFTQAAGQPQDKKFEEALLARGRHMYAVYCTPCHGAGGEGNGIVTSRGVPPPPSLSSDSVRAMKDGELFHAITFGKGNMPPHAAQIDRSDRWKIVRHLRTFTERKAP